MNEKIKADKDFRKMLLADSKITCDTLKNCFNFNASILDPSDKLSAKDTGVYLWKRGYTVKRFLGAGGFGVVWECTDENGTDIAVKVVKKGESGTEEIKNAKKLYELFSNDETAKKYFNLLEAEKDNSPILKAVLAQGDLYKNMKDKGGLRKKNKKGENKTIDSILRNAVQALKSVIKLHKKGYSHNDIKLQNFLKISNWSGKKEKEDSKSKLQERNSEIQSILKTENIDDKLEKLSTFLTTNEIKIPKIEKIKNSQNIGKEEKVKQIESIINYTMNKKIYKHRIQLADFSLVSKIPESGEGTFIKIKPNFYLSKTDLEFLGQEVDKERIEKRDVFALGRVFQLLLFRNDSSININEAVNMEKMNLNEIKNSQIYGTLKNIYQGERNDDEKGRISKFMEITIQMLKDNYNERITLEKALQEIRTIKIEI